MKNVVFALVFGGAASVAHAQVLPVPGTPGPDWVLERPAPGAPNQGPAMVQTLAPSHDPMPNALPKSIRSIGNRHSYWDAERQLEYAWVSSPGSVAPASAVQVRDKQTGTVYTYRRRSTPLK